MTTRLFIGRFIDERLHTNILEGNEMTEPEENPACPACSMSPREFQKLMLDKIKECCDLPDHGYKRVQVTLEEGRPPLVSVDFIMRGEP